MKQMIVPELTTVAEVDAQAVGSDVWPCSTSTPASVRKWTGRLFPFGFLKLIRNRKGLKRVRLISPTCCRVPKLGIGIALVRPPGARRARLGIQEAEFSGFSEEQRPIVQTLKNARPKITKQYRVLTTFGPPDTTANAKL